LRAHLGSFRHAFAITLRAQDKKEKLRARNTRLAPGHPSL
jgi:hypothetical protein